MKGFKRIHAYASCDACYWAYSDIDGHYHKKDTGQQSQKHADETGHTVRVEIGLYKLYIPR